MSRPESLLPLKPLVFDVLLILDAAESHGYGISKALQALPQQAPGEKRVLPGNLYRTLASMMERDLIEKSPRRKSEEDERRRYFRITPFGRQVAKAEAERLQQRVDTARAQRLLSGNRSS